MVEQVIEVEAPRLYPKQREAIYDPHMYSVIEASTKSGKTFGCIVWILDGAFAGKEGQNFWWVAPYYTQAEIAYRRTKLALPRGHYAANDTKQTIKLLNNGVTLWFKSADNPDSLYGEEVMECVLDEATRMREEAWWAVQTTLATTGGQVRIIGNVKGKKNWAYRMARIAEAGEDPDMGYHRITAYDAMAAGVLPEESVERAKRRMPETMFRELFLAEAGEDEGNPFGGSRAIRQCIAAPSSRPGIHYGVDLAKARDWTVVIGLDAEGYVSTFERWQAPWGITIPNVRWLTRAGRRTLVDSTGVGDVPTEVLQAGGEWRYLGYNFTSKSKQQLMKSEIGILAF